jgi:ABC-2 type transport system ATP-binding protein
MGQTGTTRAAVQVEGLEKRWGQVQAVAGLDLRVEEGACFGLLGPNGAGKTTTVAVLATLARPDAGRARVLGHDVVAERAALRRRLGIVFQEPSLDRELTAREHLDLQARLYHLDARARRVAEALEQSGLSSDADRPVRGFSGGMRRRLEIARGLLHRPEILFLDEPTVGLDVAARAAIWDALRRLRAEGGTTIFLTTHSMDEAEALCERVGIVDRGRLVVEGEPAALVAALGGDVVVLGFDGGAAAAARAAAALAAVEGVREARADGARVRVTVRDGPRRLPALLDAARGSSVSEVELHRPTLAHVFLHHTGHPFEPERLGEVA